MWRTRSAVPGTALTDTSARKSSRRISRRPQSLSPRAVPSGQRPLVPSQVTCFPPACAPLLVLSLLIMSHTLVKSTRSFSGPSVPGCSFSLLTHESQAFCFSSQLMSRFWPDSNLAESRCFRLVALLNQRSCLTLVRTHLPRGNFCLSSGHSHVLSNGWVTAPSGAPPLCQALSPSPSLVSPRTSSGRDDRESQGVRKTPPYSQPPL